MFGVCNGGDATGMHVAGVELPAGAVAELALCLRNAGETDLSHRVGVAVDTNQRDLHLSLRDRLAILLALESCPPTLLDLRVGLMIDELLRRRWTMRRLTTELRRSAVVATRRRDLIYAAARQTFEQARTTYGEIRTRVASQREPQISA